MRLEIFGVEGLGEIAAGADLAALIASCADLRDGDVVVVAQKAVSKAEGRVTTEPREQAIAAETARIVARRGDVLIAETRHGFVCANAGVDESNVAPGTLVLLPLDPDASAERIRAGVLQATGCRVGVVVSDTFGRPWRTGQTNVALGVSGLAPLLDLRGRPDRNGRVMTSTVIAVADEIAGAAELVMGKAEGIPVAIVRGLASLGAPGTGRALVRPADEDLFAIGEGGEPRP